MPKSFFGRHALLVLIVVYFSIPFALRGSRYAVQRMKNDVKDWLPTHFDETDELDWFRKRFLGEQFVVISWDGCVGTADDLRFRKFVDGLFPEKPPSVVRAEGRRLKELGASLEEPNYVDEELDLYVRSFVPDTADQEETFIGNKLSLLYQPEQEFFDWGGKQEKWLRSGKNNWVYIDSKGKLYQWTGNQTWPAQLWRGITRAFTGKQLNGTIVASLPLEDGPWYYEDPSRLNARLVKSVTSGPSVLNQLTSGQLSLDRDEAHERLRGVLFGDDDEHTCIFVTLTNAAKDDPRALVGRGMLGRERGFLLDVAEEAGVQPPIPPPALPGFLVGLFGDEPEVSGDPMLRMGGPPIDNAAIDEEGQITLARLLGLSLAVGLGLSWLCFRSINITVMVFLVGGFSAVTSVGIIYWTGSQLDAVLMSMPSLVYVLGISGAVHVVNYYRESVAEKGIATAPDNAVKLGFWPCTMAAFTTSLGLLSLATSNIVPIRKFGCYAAVGVIATLVLLFTYLPAALEMWPPRRYLKRKSASDSGDSTAPASSVERMLDNFWQAVGRFVIGNYNLVKWGCLVLLFVGVVGLTKINTSVQLLKLFDGKAKIIEDYGWLESNLGKLVPMELVVRVDPSIKDPSAVGVGLEEAVENADEIYAEPSVDGLSFLERMEISKRISAELDLLYGEAGTKEMSRPMTANTFAQGPGKGIFSDRTRSTYSKELEKSRGEYIEAGFLRDDPDDDAELWRVSLRLAALDDIDFGEFVQKVKQVVEPIMLAYEYRESVLQRLSVEAPDERPAVFVAGLLPADIKPVPAGEDRVNQTLIFVRHLQELMLNEGIKTKKIDTVEQLEDVKQTDALLMLGNVEGITSTILKKKRLLWFDARNHEFDPLIEATARDRQKRAAEIGGRPPKVCVSYTGLVPIVYKAQRTLLKSLIQSTGLAFLMIAVVMILLLRSGKAGMLAMLPNVFPIVAIFGFMGWRGSLVDIGSMMTASVAMGVAVDDTIHFLSWFRRGLDDGLSRNNAILLAYRRVATAMTQTTAIGGIGLSIFAFSTFTPTQMFGMLMLAMLAAALVGDLLFLPALLASPWGEMFDKVGAKTSGTGSNFQEGASNGATGSNGSQVTANGSKKPSRLPSRYRGDKEHG